MVLQTILCVLAACGLVLVLWVFFGAWVLPLRPKRGRVALLWQAVGNEEELRRQYEAFAWLRESGLGPDQLILWDSGLEPAARRLAEYWARSDPRVTLAGGEQTLETLAQMESMR